jgi:hypothetical protein
MDLISVIANTSMTMAQMNVMNQIQTQVLDMSMTTATEQGDAIAKMLETSVNPNLGANIDVSI